MRGECEVSERRGEAIGSRVCVWGEVRGSGSGEREGGVCEVEVIRVGGVLVFVLRWGRG